jgi:predicted glutamine amidotransferase
MNLVLSDGQKMVATRYVSKGEGSNSLYTLNGGQFCCQDGQCSMDEGGDAVLVASEPLSSSPRWQKVANNHLITVDPDRNISVQSM